MKAESGTHHILGRQRAGPATALRGGALILAMATGSVAMWIGVPVGWLYLASQLTSSSDPQLGLYVLVLVCIPLTMALVGRGLHALDRVYERVVGLADDEPRRSPWLRSMRDTRGSGRRTTVLDRVMVVSVVAALGAIAIWFLFFAGSSLPTGP